MTAEEKNPWAEIIGPCYTTASLARALRWTETEVFGAAAALEVLEVETVEGTRLYPAFQVRDGRVIEGLHLVLRELGIGTASRWTWAQWLNSPYDDDSGEPAPTAIEQLLAGQLDDVLRDARHAAASWSQ